MYILLTVKINNSSCIVNRVKRYIQLECHIKAVTNVFLCLVRGFNFVSVKTFLQKILPMHYPAISAGGVGLHSPPSVVSASFRM
jgi:hypothetical protein